MYNYLWGAFYSLIGIFIITGCDWQRTSKEPSKKAQHQQVIKIG
ncbi:hypothetical protein ACQKH8_15650, partial [Staphylococcus aureus]